MFEINYFEYIHSLFEYPHKMLGRVVNCTEENNYELMEGVRVFNSNLGIMICFKYINNNINIEK